MTDTIPAERPAGGAKKEKMKNIPIQLESRHPGKTRWRIWSTEFEIDDKYVPIKVGWLNLYCHLNSFLMNNEKFNDSLDTLQTLQAQLAWLCRLLEREPMALFVRQENEPQEKGWQ